MSGVNNLQVIITVDKNFEQKGARVLSKKKKPFSKYGYRNTWNDAADYGGDSTEIKIERVSAAFIWNNDLSYAEFHFIAINDCGMLKSQLFIS